MQLNLGGTQVTEDASDEDKNEVTYTVSFSGVLVEMGGCDTALSGAILDNCDGTLLMVENRHTPVDEALSALQGLSAFRPPVLGALLVQRQAAA